MAFRPLQRILYLWTLWHKAASYSSSRPLCSLSLRLSVKAALIFIKASLLKPHRDSGITAGWSQRLSLTKDNLSSSHFSSLYILFHFYSLLPLVTPPLSSFLPSAHFSSLFPLFFHLISSPSCSSLFPFSLLYAIHLFWLYFILISSFLIPSSQLSYFLFPPPFLLHSHYIFSVLPLFLLNVTYLFSPYLILSPPIFLVLSLLLTYFSSSFHRFSSPLLIYNLFSISPICLISPSVSIF